MEEEKDAFYVVRKGDVIGIYKNLNDCQDQVSSSVTDPSVSVYKGYSLPKESEDFLKSHGLKDALYTIPAADVKDGIFGQLIPCPFQQPSSSQEPLTGSIQPCPHPSGGKQAEKVSPRKRSRDEIDDGPNNMLSCTLQFDGASKGNPGLAGAGAVLRSEDGTVYRLREGVGVATNNVAEYRALILGLRHAIRVGFKKIRIQGDSKLVCCQVNGEWKIKHQNMASLCKVVNDLKTKFTSFQINHILREYNSEADGLANLALNLKDGQVEVECIRK